MFWKHQRAMEREGEAAATLYRYDGFIQAESRCFAGTAQHTTRNPRRRQVEQSSNPGGHQEFQQFYYILYT